MGTITKRLAGGTDHQLWDGTVGDKTFTAVTSTGRTMTLRKLGYRPEYDWTAQFGDIITKGPWVDVRAFGASGSEQSTTGSMSAGSKQLTLATAKDFENGQGIRVVGAGSSGGDLVATIESGEGTTTLTLDTAASTTVSGANVYHDDTQALQDAIDAAWNSGSYQRGVLIPAGYVFLVSSPISLPDPGSNHLRFTIMGLGGVGVLKASTTTAAVLTTYEYSGNDADYPSNWTRDIIVRDLYIDGNSVATDGIRFWKFVHAVFDNVEVDNCTNAGFYFHKGIIYTLNNCVAAGNTNYGVVARGGTTISMWSGEYKTSDTGVYFGYDGVPSGDTENDHSPHHVQMYGTIIEGNNKYGLYIGGGTGGEYNAAYFEDNGDYHVYIDDDEPSVAGQLPRYHRFVRCNFSSGGTISNVFYLGSCTGIVFDRCRDPGILGGMISANAHVCRFIKQPFANGFDPVDGNITNNHASDTNSPMFEDYEHCKHYVRVDADNMLYFDGRYPLLWFMRALGGSGIINSKVSGDAGIRFKISADGTHEWGKGDGTRKVKAYRSSSGDALVFESPIVWKNSQATISSGEITVTDSSCTVYEETSGVADDLDTIDGAVQTGQVLFLHPAGTATITLKDNTGNLRLAGDFVMDKSQDSILLWYNGTNWQEICRSSNA